MDEYTSAPLNKVGAVRYRSPAVLMLTSCKNMLEAETHDRWRWVPTYSIMLFGGLLDVNAITVERSTMITLLAYVLY